MENQNNVPEGYLKDYAGRLHPKEIVKPIDLARDELVKEIIEKALPIREDIKRFKEAAYGDIRSFVEMSTEQYGVKLGGKKGGVSLTSFDGRYKVSISVQNHINFDERVEAAKELIDKCLLDWTDGVRPELRVIIENAFRANRKGQLRTSEVLGLKNLEIDDENWRQAMKALIDSLQVYGSTAYINLYERVGDSDSWRHISLDLASV